MKRAKTRKGARSTRRENVEINEQEAEEFMLNRDETIPFIPFLSPRPIELPDNENEAESSIGLISPSFTLQPLHLQSQDTRQLPDTSNQSSANPIIGPFPHQSNAPPFYPPVPVFYYSHPLPSVNIGYHPPPLQPLYHYPPQPPPPPFNFHSASSGSLLTNQQDDHNQQNPAPSLPSAEVSLHHPPPPYVTYHSPQAHHLYYPPPLPMYHHHHPIPVPIMRNKESSPVSSGNSKDIDQEEHSYNKSPLSDWWQQTRKRNIDNLNLTERDKQRLARNRAMREREHELKERIKIIESKAEEQKTEDEIKAYNLFHERRQRKNDRSRERTKENREKMETILSIPENTRTDEQKEWLAVALKAKQRKNESDRLRRKRIKMASGENTPQQRRREQWGRNQGDKSMGTNEQYQSYSSSNNSRIARDHKNSQLQEQQSHSGPHVDTSNEDVYNSSTSASGKEQPQPPGVDRPTTPSNILDQLAEIIGVRTPGPEEAWDK